MTAVLAYLRGLSVGEWVGIAAASWLILAALGSAGMARAAHVLKRRVRPAKPEVWLTDPVVRDRCHQIETAEGWVR